MDQVAERLAELRERRALTLRELAQMSGVATDTINQIELGHRKARPSTLRKLARALEIDVQEFYTEPALPKAEAPGTGQAQTSTQHVEEFEQALTRVLEPVRKEALREAQANARLRASEGIPQTRIGAIPEAEAGNRFLDEFSPDERPLAFGEVALGYARLEREHTNLLEALRERDEKIAQLEEENAHLRERERETAR